MVVVKTKAGAISEKREESIKVEAQQTMVRP